MRYFRDCNTLHKRGFSLIELIIVIAIIGIVSSIATLNFNQWLVKSRVEAQVKQMVSDIGELRIRALTTKQRHSVTFNPSSYVFRTYSTETEPLSGGVIVLGGTHNVNFRLKDVNKDDFTGLVKYEIDVRGLLVGSTASVFLDYNGSAALDCFTFHTVRVNPGKKSTVGAKYVCDDK